MIRCGVAALLFSLATGAIASAWPEITSVAPLALRPGAETPLAFTGSGLGEATNLWMSIDAGQAHGHFTGTGKFSVRLSASAPVGIFGLRLFGATGPSELRLIMVDDLPTTLEQTTNKARATAQAIACPMAVDATCDELSSDWFTIHVAKGERVAVEVVSARLGFRLDSVLRVVDVAGREMAYSDDGFGIRADSRCVFVAPKSGDYWIEVRDVNFGGGDDFRYRLRIGDFPLVNTTWPPVIKSGARQVVEVLSEDASAHRVTVTPSEEENSIPIALETRSGFGSGFARVLVTRQDVACASPGSEVEPRRLPVWFATRFNESAQPGLFRFTVPTSGPVSFHAHTRAIGSPCDVVLRIEDSSGARLAESNPTVGAEDFVTHRFGSSGTYVLKAREITGALGDGLVCAIEAAPAPGFALSVDDDRADVEDDNAFEMKVGCARSGYKGAIRIGVAGLPILSITNNLIGEGKTNTTLRVLVPGGVGDRRLVHARIFGQNAVDRDAPVVFVNTTPAWRKRFPRMLFPPAEFDGRVAVVLPR